MARRQNVNAKAKSEAGAAFLDVRMPNWHRFVRCDTLDIGNESQCVIGQLMGDYLFGRLKLGLGHEQTSAYGFYLSRGVHFKNLTSEWRKRIAERRRQDIAEESSRLLAKITVKWRISKIYLIVATVAASTFIALL